VSLIILEGVSLSFGPKTIASNLGLRIAESDRIGLIGPNGSGKTTLLRILVGEQAVDRGSVQRSRGVRVGYLPQDISVTGGRRLLDFVLSSVPGRQDLGAQLAEAEAELETFRSAVGGGAEDGTLMALASRIADIHERLDHSDRFFSEHKALQILSGLGFRAADRARDLAEFSGGWKMRAVLASLLFQQPDLLLLDEPTNHLDMPSVAWLADFLKRYRQALVLISHDREFLNEQVTRIVSLEIEGVRQYAGDYDQYVRQRAEEERLLENKARNLERERARLKRFIDRFRAQAKRARAVQSRVKALERMEAVTTFQPRRIMRFSFPPTARTVKQVVRVKKLRKTFGDLVLFPSVDLAVQRGEKIGIIGANGVGKTTLLKMLAGELEPDGGVIEIGSSVQVGYYAQHHAETLHPELSAYEEVAQANPDASQLRVRSLLGAFLFSGDDVEKKVSVLSGGERARVALARLLINPGSLLLMDEPSNHLDLESSESLAESLTTYDGTLIFVSHNRSLVRRLATRIWNIEGGAVETYPGSLDDYMYSCRVRREAETREANEEPGADAAKPQARAAVAARAVLGPPPKESRQEERVRKRREAERRQKRSLLVAPIKKRVDELETRISKLDALQVERSAQLSDPEVYCDDGRRNRLLNEYQEAAAKLEELTGRWEVALEELDKAEAELAAELETSS